MEKLKEFGKGLLAVIGFIVACLLFLLIMGTIYELLYIIAPLIFIAFFIMVITGKT